MDRTRLLPQIPSLSSFLLLFFLIQCQVWCLHIRPEPCQNSMGDIGTCMFVWECIKTEGKHLGTCADGFLFGSCCTHNDSKNNIIPSDSDATTQSHKETTPSLPLSKQTSTSFHSSTTPSSHSSFESPSISHFSSKPFHLKPSSTTFRPIFTSPVHIKTTLKPFSTTLKLSYTRPPFKPSSIVNSTHKVRPSFKPTTNLKPPFIKPLSKPFSTTTKLEFIWSTSNLESTTSRPVYVRPTHKTTFKPIFVRPTTKPQKPTIVYPPMITGSNSSMGNFSSAIKTTNKPPLKSTTKKYGFISSTHKWAQPTSFQPSHISTKKPYFPPRTSTTYQPSVAHWTSNYPYSRPSWKPTLKPTSIFTSNPFIYTYSTNNYTTRPSFTPFATRSTRLPTPSSSVYHTTLSVKPSFDHVTTFNYSTDITTAFEQTMNVTINENFFTTHRPFTTSRQTTSNQNPFSPSTFEYFTQQSSNHGWFYPQYNKSTTVTSPTTSFFTSQENSTLSNVSTPESFISEGTHHTSESVSLSTFMVSHPLDLSSEAVTLTEEKTTTPFPVTPCGTPRPHPKQKVVGGKNSAFGSWPWQASVRRTSFFGFSSTHRCGGALISREWVATAGHCVDDLLIGQIKIRVGEYDFASIQEPHGYVERGIVKKVVHPRYNFFTYENDLALVKLEEAIDLTKHPHISPICLPPSEENLIGRNATVTGWGRLSEGGVLPSILQEVQVPIISNEKCKNMFLAAGRHEYIPDIFLCAGFEEGGRDSCQGDSGGPLQIKTDEGYWYLAGIISWGIGCAEPNMPGVCTRISKFKDWVVKQIT